MYIILFVAVIALIFGVLMLFAPKFVEFLNDLGNKIILTDEKTIAYRYVTGAVLIGIAIALLIELFIL